MKRKWIYIILAVVLVSGFFYMVLEKDQPSAPDTSQEKDQPSAPDTSQEKENQEKLQDDQKINEEETEDNIEDEDTPEENTQGQGGPRVDTEFSEIEIGQKLPDFTLKDLNGQEVNLRELEGKMVLINFWATWCHWCDKEMPDLDKLDKENEDLIVLGVNVDEPKSQVEEYVKEGGYDFKVVLDEGGKIAGNYLVTGLPASYFVNKDGIYVGRIPSYMTAEQMNEALQITRDY